MCTRERTRLWIHTVVRTLKHIFKDMQTHTRARARKYAQRHVLCKKELIQINVDSEFQSPILIKIRTFTHFIDGLGAIYFFSCQSNFYLS